ncbi:MAG: signal peptidase I [Fibrobacteres bacterium]|nr:signal peptidase I [Fibrobacterota bacterium]
MSEFYDVGQERKGTRDIRILLLEIFETVVFIGLAAFVFRTFFFAPFGSPGFGMAGTLLPGEHVLANRIIYGLASPFTGEHIIRLKHVKRNEVVVFNDPVQDGKYAIKRCVAVGGQSVRIEEKRLYVDSVEFKLPEESERGAELIIDGRFSPRDNLAQFRIPAKGDTVYLDSLKIFELDYIANLIRQENPGKRLTSTADLMVNGKYANDLTFDDYRSEQRKPDGTLNFDAMNWIELNNVLNFLQAKDDSLKCSFRRTMYVDGKELKKYVVKTRAIFLMGDNWDESMDSRYTGYISEERVVARVSLIFWSKYGGNFRFRRLFLFI